MKYHLWCTFAERSMLLKPTWCCYCCCSCNLLYLGDLLLQNFVLSFRFLFCFGIGFSVGFGICFGICFGFSFSFSFSFTFATGDADADAGDSLVASSLTVLSLNTHWVNEWVGVPMCTMNAKHLMQKHTTHDTTRHDTIRYTHRIWWHTGRCCCLWKTKHGSDSERQCGGESMVYSLAHPLGISRYWYLRRAAVSISLYFQLGCCFSSMNMGRKFVAIIQYNKKTEFVFVC